MDIGIIVIILLVLLVLGLIRKLGWILKLIITVVLAAVLLVSYILIFPTSPVSKTCTSWAAQNIELDPKDEHLNGEEIFSYSLEDLASEATEGMDALAGALAGNEQLSEFFSERLAALVKSQAKELTDSEDKVYRLDFKDAYLEIDCSNAFIVISIIKEEQTDEVPA